MDEGDAPWHFRGIVQTNASATAGPWKPRQAALYLWVEDVDATYARALQAGGTSEFEPQDKAYGHRNAGVIDQNGVTWWIGATVK